MSEQSTGLPFTKVQKQENLTRSDLDTLWKECRDVPLDYDNDGHIVAIEGVPGSDRVECIDVAFYIWPRGAEIDEVRRWFDDMYASLGTCLAERWFSEAGKAARREDQLNCQIAKENERAAWEQ